MWQIVRHTVPSTFRRYWANNDMDGKPWVAISDLHGRVIDFTSESYHRGMWIANSNVKLVKRGTVLMSFKLSLGRVAFAGRDLYTNEAIASIPSQRPSYPGLPLLRPAGCCTEALPRTWRSKVRR